MPMACLTCGGETKKEVLAKERLTLGMSVSGLTTRGPGAAPAKPYCATVTYVCPKCSSRD